MTDNWRVFIPVYGFIWADTKYRKAVIAYRQSCQDGDYAKEDKAREWQHYTFERSQAALYFSIGIPGLLFLTSLIIASMYPR